MLTPRLQRIINEIRESTDPNYPRYLTDWGIRYKELQDVLEQMDRLETTLSKAYEAGGLSEANRVIIRPAEPNCQIDRKSVV